MASLTSTADNPTTPSPFRDSRRVIYKRNPLGEVICQVRFPPILRIDAEPPASFQERIRGEYPLLNEKRIEPEIELPVGIPAALTEILKGLPKKKPVGYDFGSADGNWKISLTKESLALTAAKYERWEDFRRQFDGPLKALIEEFNPSFFTRIGLRYPNIIQRSKLNIPTTTNWSQLIHPYVIGVLSVDEVSSAVEEYQNQATIKLGAYGGHVRMRTGIIETADTHEECFLIDNDFFSGERTKINDVDGILTYFNRQSGRLFRWCIQDRLDTAMEPGPV